jgi:hypothetical protein
MHRYIFRSLFIVMVSAGFVQAHAQTSPAKTHLSIEQRLRRIEDKDEIRELLVAHGRDFDKRDFTSCANL